MEVNKIFAFDTETKDGKAFYLTHCDNAYKYGIDITNTIDIITYLDWLFKANLKVGFCFNLDYDVIALLSHFKTDIDLIEVYTAKEFRLGAYYCTYLKNKAFKISKKSGYSGKSINIFDIQQYYNSSLKIAAEKYLKDKKIDIGKNRSNKIYDYYLKHFKQFHKYALQDAILTYQLAEIIIKEIPSINKFYSSGYIAYTLYPKLNNGFKIDFKTDIFVRNSYFGGRIEFLKRGTFKNVYIYDLKSAYPSVISNLYNVVYTKFSNKIDKKATYNFINCIITVPDQHNIGFLPLRKDVLTYPCGTFEVTIDNYTYDYIKTLGATATIKNVLNCYSDNTQPYKKIIEYLFTQRQKGGFANYFYKLLLNSIYGKKAERRKTYEAIDINTFEQLQNELIDNELSNINSTFDLTKIKNQFFKIDRTLRGKQYNIIEASIITSLIRLKLLKTAIKLTDKNVIGFMTDSIFSLKELPNNEVTNVLGGWELQSKEKSLLVVGSGVYQTAKGTKLRGFNSKIDLKKEFKKYKNKTSIPIDVNSRTGLGTYIRSSNETIIDLNSINQIDRILKLNFDTKRKWNKKINTTSILKDSQNSKIIKI